MVSNLKAIAKATKSEGLVKAPNLAIIKTKPSTKPAEDGAPKVALTFNLGDPNDLTSMSQEDDGKDKEPSVAVSSHIFCLPILG